MRRSVVVAGLMLLASVSPAVAGEYEPGTVPPESTSRPASSGRVLHVGRGGIQAAVNRARAGDTIRVAPGTYRGRVEIRGASKRGLRLVGDRATLRGAIVVRDTAAITIRGLGILGGGVTLRSVDRYALDRLRVSGSETAGIDVRRSRGGSITRVLASSNHGAGIGIAGSPALVRPVRTFVRDVTVQANTVGIAIDHADATTITRTRVLDNDMGVSLDGAGDLVLRDNDIRSSGIGIGLSGGRNLIIEGNRFLLNRTDVHVIDPPES
jgi:nitrous oxidase accessory protein NosD